ncbi:carbohydrate sulfotransferase 11-like [Clytia hemisphaerica]|uniref:Carbohydrate sulfotransferase n=1 Tax=Clytia hemisphaerica TaxID=252671 RepID=A0A7M6DPI5_9CNID|eukprot:TCONS_00008534-protein
MKPYNSLSVLLFGMVLACVILIFRMSELKDIFSFLTLTRIKPTEEGPSTKYTSETQQTRHDQLQKFCATHQNIHYTRKYDANLMYSRKQKIMYCHIPKVACSTWKKIMAYFLGLLKSPWKDVTLAELYGFDIPSFQTASNLTINQIKSNKNYYSFMFARHPYDRLFSAYRNKFLDPVNLGYLKHYGPMIISMDVNPLSHRKRSDGLYRITFEQFVKFVIKAGPDFDDHWRPQTRICHICDLKYKYLGKFETMENDANYIFKTLNESLKFPKMAEYKLKTTQILKKYYTELPKPLMTQIFEFYRNDFDAFGYDPNYFF